MCNLNLRDFEVFPYEFVGIFSPISSQSMHNFFYCINVRVSRKFWGIIFREKHSSKANAHVLYMNAFLPTQSHGVCAAPGAKEERLQAIKDKIAARMELLSRPQRFASSRPLSRREMEIEQALFHGNDRLGFLTALYHRGTELLVKKKSQVKTQILHFRVLIESITAVWKSCWIRDCMILTLWAINDTFNTASVLF